MARKTEADPTGQAGNRRKGTAALRARLETSRRQVLSLFRSISFDKSVERLVDDDGTQTIYYYDANPPQIQQLNDGIKKIISDNLLENYQQNNYMGDWYWKDNVEPPYRQGTAHQIVEYNILIASALVLGLLQTGSQQAQTINVTSYLLSAQYRSGLQNLFINNFNSIQSLSDRTGNQVSMEVVNGINSGLSPKSIVGSINGRFNVAKSSASRTSNTEINKAYNVAMTTANNQISDDTGLRTAVLHISALLPTTRPTHAARHGNVYTVAEQNQWWDTGANRINCHCSVRSVLLDKNGKPINAEV